MSNNHLLVGKWCRLAMLTMTVATQARAQQQPGTNATPAPGNAMTTQSDAVPGPAEQSTETGLAPEPVIDAESSSAALPNRPLLITGAVLLGGSYGASAIVAATSNRAADDKLYYPVVGPWMDLNRRNCNVEACPNKTLDRVLLIGDGIVQGVGALGVLLSLVIPERITHRWYLIGDGRLMIVPRFDHSMLGIGASSTF
jgi:hypothetical protein